MDGWLAAHHRLLTALAWLVCAAATLPRLDRPAYQFDEQLYAARGWDYVHPGSPRLAVISQGNFEHPPLAKLLFGLGQLVLGDPEGTVASRVVASSAFLVAAVLLGATVSRLAGQGWGLVTSVTFVLLPTPVAPQITNLGRSALLDSVCVAFVAGTCWAAVRWVQARSSSEAWRWALLLGTFTGLATASKENGFLAAVGLVAATVLARRSTWRHEIARGVAAAGVCGLAFVLSYLPFDRPFERIRYLVDYQLHHSDAGHPAGVSGQVYAHPPWWANLWFAHHSLGLVITVMVLVGLLLAVMSRRREVLVLAAGLAGPILFHCFVAGVALGFYWWLWWSIALAIAVAGLAEAPRLGARVGPGGERAGRALQLVAVATILVLSATTVWRVLTLSPEGGNGVTRARQAHGLHGRVLATGVYAQELVPADRTMKISLRPDPATLRDVDTVVIGARRCRTVPDRGVLATLARARNAGTASPIYRDRLFTVYRVTSPLALPSQDEIAAQPQAHPADGC